MFSIDKQLKQQILTLPHWELVYRFFMDSDKSLRWFATSNPQLGNVAPASMIKMGREKKLLKFIETQFAENEA